MDMQGKPYEKLSIPANNEETVIRLEYLPGQKVKMLPSKHGETIDS